jgi:hypothetical protein
MALRASDHIAYEHRAHAAALTSDSVPLPASGETTMAVSARAGHGAS